MAELHPNETGYFQSLPPSKQQQQFEESNMGTQIITTNNIDGFPNAAFPYNTHFFPSTANNTPHIPALRDPRVVATCIGLIWSAYISFLLHFQLSLVHYLALIPFGFFVLFCGLTLLAMAFYSFRLLLGPGADNAIITTYPTEKPILIPPPPSTQQPSVCLNCGTLSGEHRVPYETDRKSRSVVRKAAIWNFWASLLFLVGSSVALLASNVWISPLYYAANFVLTAAYAYCLNAVILMEHESRQEWTKWNSFDARGNLINAPIHLSVHQHHHHHHQDYLGKIGYTSFVDIEQYPTQTPHQQALLQRQQSPDHPQRVGDNKARHRYGAVNDNTAV